MPTLPLTPCVALGTSPLTSAVREEGASAAARGPRRFSPWFQCEWRSAVATQRFSPAWCRNGVACVRGWDGVTHTGPRPRPPCSSSWLIQDNRLLPLLCLVRAPCSWAWLGVCTWAAGVQARSSHLVQCPHAASGAAPDACPRLVSAPPGPTRTVVLQHHLVSPARQSSRSRGQAAPEGAAGLPRPPSAPPHPSCSAARQGPSLPARHPARAQHHLAVCSRGCKTLGWADPESIQQDTCTHIHAPIHVYTYMCTHVCAHTCPRAALLHHSSEPLSTWRSLLPCQVFPPTWESPPRLLSLPPHPSTPSTQTELGNPVLLPPQGQCHPPPAPLATPSIATAGPGTDPPPGPAEQEAPPWGAARPVQPLAPVSAAGRSRGMLHAVSGCPHAVAGAPHHSPYARPVGRQELWPALQLES